MRGLLRDLGDQLHAGGPGADDGDALAGEVHALVRPQPGVERVAPEAVAAGELGQVRRRQAAHGGDEEAGREALAVLGVDQPAPGVVVPGRCRDRGPEADVAAQVEAVRDGLQVAQDLRLAREALAPRPLLEEVLGEPVGEAVEVALRVAPRARVAVPVPGAPDVVGRLEHQRRHPEGVPQAVEHVQTGEPGSHHQGVELTEIGGHGLGHRRPPRRGVHRSAARCSRGPGPRWPVWCASPSESERTRSVPPPPDGRAPIPAGTDGAAPCGVGTMTTSWCSPPAPLPGPDA